VSTLARGAIDVAATIKRVGIIPVMRAESRVHVSAVVETLLAANLPIIEITMTVPDALASIVEISRRFGNRLLVGAGTVTDAETAQRAVDAGAQFIVSPGVVEEVIDAALRGGVLALPGALTPTEIIRALAAGASMVKIFPIAAVGGASYIRALRGPFPGVDFVPTGGVTIEMTRELLRAGAAAVGVGSELISGEAVRRGEHSAIAELAQRFLSEVERARGGLRV
jgi:2-dehydro-3-deoxyphosphogluconate aldolase/(4S)-4-hydroxy-2-oxoglutarate aldolase